MIKISLKDGVIKEFDAGITAAEVAKNLGMGLYKAACVCRIDGEVAELLASSMFVSSNSVCIRISIS